MQGDESSLLATLAPSTAAAMNLPQLDGLSACCLHREIPLDLQNFPTHTPTHAPPRVSTAVIPSLPEHSYFASTACCCSCSAGDTFGRLCTTCRMLQESHTTADRDGGRLQCLDASIPLATTHASRHASWADLGPARTREMLTLHHQHGWSQPRAPWGHQWPARQPACRCRRQSCRQGRAHR